MIANGDGTVESMVDVFGLATKLSYPSIALLPSVYDDTVAQVEPDTYASVFSPFMREQQIESTPLLHGLSTESSTPEYRWSMDGRPNKAWSVMRPTTPSARPPKGLADGNGTRPIPAPAPSGEHEARAARLSTESETRREMDSLPAGTSEGAGSGSVLLDELLSGQRSPAVLTSDEWPVLAAEVPRLASDRAAALNVVLGDSIERLGGTRRLFGIVCSLRLGLLSPACWAPCCSRLESYWDQFLVLADYASRCQFLGVFVEFVGRLEIDEAWGLKIVADCFLLIKTTRDDSQRLVIDLLSTLCRRSQALADRVYETLCSSCEGHAPVGAPMSWTTLFLISDFYASLGSQPPCGAPRSLAELLLLRRFEVLASRLRDPGHGSDRGDTFLDCLARDFGQARERSAEWVALLCISKLLLAEFVRRPGPFLLRQEHLDVWSSLARLVRGCEGALDDCPLGAFVAKELRFAILAKAPTPAASTLGPLFASPGVTTETPMSAVLATLGATSDRYFAVLLRLLGDGSASMRVRAIRALSRLIDANDQVAKNQNFIKALCNRFEDQSPLVREAALDFYFVLRKISDQESTTLALSKLDDPSPLVRRRVIKIVEAHLNIPALDPSVSAELRAVLISGLSVEGRALADLAFSVLLNSWLLPFVHKRAELLAKGETIPLRQAMANLTAEIIKTIRSPRTSTAAFQAFSARVRESTRGEEWSLICREIVDLLFETLISSVESGNDSAVTFILAAIVVFATDSMDCIGTHLKLICRLILSSDLETVEHSLDLLKRLLRTVDSTPSREVPELVRDLCRLSLCRSNSIVRSAIECLGCLATRDPNALERLRHLVAKHRSIIAPTGQTAGPPEATLRCRSLYLLSMLARAACSNGLAIDVPPELVIDALAHLPRADPRIAVLCACSCAELFAIPLVAIKPPFISIVKGILAEACATAQLSVLKGLLSLFVKPDTSSAKSSFDLGGDSSPDETSSLLATFQVYCIELQRLILEGDARLDEVLVSIFVAVLSQGLVPPQTLLPYVLCAWHPSSPRAQQRVALQCTGVLQKFEPYFALVPRQTLRLTYQYLCKTGTLCHRLFCSTDGTAESYLHELFECLSTKSGRLECLSSLMQEIECQSLASHYLVFLLTSMAQLPFKSEEELRLVLRRIDEQVAVGGDYSELDLARPQQIRQLLVLETRNYLCSSYRIQSQESTGQGPPESVPRRLKLDPFRPSDLAELEALDPRELLEKVSLSLHTQQGTVATGPTTVRRMPPSRRSRSKRRRKTYVSDDDESSAGEVYE